MDSKGGGHDLVSVNSDTNSVGQEKTFAGSSKINWDGNASGSKPGKAP